MSAVIKVRKLGKPRERDKDKAAKVAKAPRVAKVPRTTRAKKADKQMDVEASVSPRATSPWQQTGFIVPASVVSRVDIARLVREFEGLDNTLTSIAVRKKAGATQQSAPVISPQLSEFLEINSLDLNNSGARTDYIKQLRLLKDTAPIIHMTFAVVADSESLQQLVAWLRKSVHPQTIIDVHLQPALVAGVYVRTPNQVHDLSLRGKLDGQRAALVQELGALRG